MHSSHTCTLMQNSRQAGGGGGSRGPLCINVGIMLSACRWNWTWHLLPITWAAPGKLMCALSVHTKLCRCNDHRKENRNTCITSNCVYVSLESQPIITTCHVFTKYVLLCTWYTATLVCMASLQRELIQPNWRTISSQNVRVGLCINLLIIIIPTGHSSWHTPSTTTCVGLQGGCETCECKCTIHYRQNSKHKIVNVAVVREEQATLGWTWPMHCRETCYDGSSAGWVPIT